MCRVLMMPELSTQRPSTTKNWPSLDNQHPTIRTWLILILKQPSESFRVCIFFALALILFLKSYESRGTKVFRSKQKSPPNKKNHLLPLCYENKTKQKKGKNRKMPETHGKLGKAHCSCLLLLFVCGISGFISHHIKTIVMKSRDIFYSHPNWLSLIENVT